MELTALLILFVLLLLLEYIYWLSPLAPHLERFYKGLGDWYYLFPFHYLLRLAALGAVLYGFRPALWPVFAGGAYWLYSLLWGLVLSAAGLLLSPKPAREPRSAFWGKARQWQQTGGWQFWAYAAYLTVYPGFVEELLFRWFFTAALWPVIGWGAAVAAPLLNLLWHLPVWWSYTADQAPERRGRAVSAIAFPATVFAFLLTLLAALTHNLVGPVLAHAFLDWAGAVNRHTMKQTD